MSKHTPGPWAAELWNNSSTDDIGWTITRNGSRVPTSTFDGDEAEAEANARLIAAAPDLLEALSAMLEQFNYNTITGIVHDESAAIAKARAAIAKAEEA
jgi:hypothetical protein